VVKTYDETRIPKIYSAIPPNTIRRISIAPYNNAFGLEAVFEQSTRLSNSLRIPEENEKRTRNRLRPRGNE